MPSNIYRINRAGIYAVGHFRFVGLKLDLGRPRTIRQVDIHEKEIANLMDVLGIDWENGGYLSDLLEGQNVLVTDDEEGNLHSIGDPYGNRSIDLKETDNG